MKEAEEFLTKKREFIVVVAGGTAGHVFPAISLADVLHSRGYRVAFGIDKRGLRYTASFEENIVLKTIRSGRLRNKGILDSFFSFFSIILGIFEALFWFALDRPRCIVGFGGYPSFPGLCAALLLRIPFVIHEQNSVLGLVNHIFASRARLVVLGMPEVTNLPTGVSPVYVGNPVRDEVVEFSETHPYSPVRSDGKICILVFGGSQGSRIFSETLKNVLPLLDAALLKRLVIWHQVRAEDEVALRSFYEQKCIENIVKPFFNRLPMRMADAHLVISRAGAITIAELSILGRPSILAPLPAATSDHQMKNAQTLEKAGAAILWTDKQFKDSQATAKMLESLLSDSARMMDMANKAKALGVADASTNFANKIMQLNLKERKGVKA
jgi:UDP-N-acetylglucosamine--N-acetylmuramyl-(pentapeptide) pyrophosphoryl-undecaprenol N-acetylglucosamine transferase